MKISEETRVEIEKLKKECNAKCFNLIAAEAKANNPYKNGDIIEDHYQIGRVLKSIIQINLDREIYNINYRCERLTKKLKPYLNGEITTIYFDNIESKIVNK